MKRLIFIISCLLMSTSWANEFDNCDDATKFAELNTSLCTTVSVPLSYRATNTEKLELFVRKFPSVKARKGSVWLIAGGPGESGASFYSIIDSYRNTFAHFDVFVADHRGTGHSSVICPGEAVTSTAGKTLVGQEWGDCFGYMYANPERVKAFNITNAAKDLRFLINSMSGDGQIFLYGVSYGTQLVLRTAQLDELQIDGIILDSLVPMQDDKTFDLSKRSTVVDSVGQQLLEVCNDTKACMGETAKSIKAKLAQLIKKSNNLKDYSSNLPDASLTNTLGMLLDVPHLRNEIPSVIISLSKNESSKLEQAIEDITAYYAKFNAGYANYGSSIPLVQVITASENNLRPKLTKTEVLAEETGLLFTSPLPTLIAENSMPTYQRDEFFAKLPKRLPRTLIVHGTLDPKTHYEAATKHAVELGKVGKVSFVEIAGGVHFIGLNAPTCFKDNVELFLSSKLPAQVKCQDQKSIVRF